MAADERATRMMRLLEFINEQGQPVPVSTVLATFGREYGVSEVTLRSDLATLCTLHAVRRTARGFFGPVPTDPTEDTFQETVFAARLRNRAESKAAIGAAAADVIRASRGCRVLLLDAGTTAYYVADALTEMPGLDLRVWTPSVAAALRLAENRSLSVRLLGGEYNPDYAAVYGDEVVRTLRQLAPTEEWPVGGFPGTHCVLDVNSISPTGRLVTDESHERRQKALMVELAAEVTIVADAGKLFAQQLGLEPHEIGTLFDLATTRRVALVTDASASDEQRATCRGLFANAAGEGKTTERRAGAAWIIGNLGSRTADSGLAGR